MPDLDALLTGARELYGDQARPEDVQAFVLSMIFQRHYIDPESTKTSPDNLSSCVCGWWSEGEMEPGWDDHLAEIAVEAGFALRSVQVPVTEEMVERGAKAWHEAKHPGQVWDDMNWRRKDHWRRTARAALTAALSLPSPGTTTEEE